MLHANWQLLLIDQVTRGIFSMHPQLAIGMAPQLEKFILGTGYPGISEGSRPAAYIVSDERAPFPVMAIAEDQSSYSVYDEAPEGSIAIIPVRGAMFKYGTWWTYGTTEIAEYIREAARHKNISAIVLLFDSGGGYVSAIAPLVDAINYAKAQGKPVVASVDLCCSAAYYAACHCDYIIADNEVSAEIGSIGVMIAFMDLIPYYEQLGVKFHKIYSDHSQHKNEAFELALQGKYDLIKKETLNPMALGFQDVVKVKRGSKLVIDVVGLLTGKTFFAKDAVANGLIDEVGSLERAIEIARIKSESRKFLPTP